MRKVLFVSIFAMTILDLGLTATGIRRGTIGEGNPLLEKMFHASPEMSAVILAVLVGLLLLLMYKVQYRIKWINLALVGLFVIKLAVLGLHLNWIIKI